MIGQLFKKERQYALVILLSFAVCGLAMAAVGRDDPLGVHGGLMMLSAIVGIFFVISGYYTPEPTPERLSRYYDDRDGTKYAKLRHHDCASQLDADPPSQLHC